MFSIYKNWWCLVSHGDLFIFVHILRMIEAYMYNNSQVCGLKCPRQTKYSLLSHIMLWLSINRLPVDWTQHVKRQNQSFETIGAGQETLWSVAGGTSSLWQPVMLTHCYGYYNTIISDRQLYHHSQPFSWFSYNFLIYSLTL